MKRWMFLGLVAMTGLLWLACTGGGASPSASDGSDHPDEGMTHGHGETMANDGDMMHEDGEGGGGGAVHLTLDEWSISGHDGGNAFTVDEGELVLEAHNNGEAPHALSLIRTDLDPANLPVADGVVDEEAAGELVGTIDEFAGGEIQVGTFHLTPGKYVLACNIPGHYQQGMYAQITVH